MTFPFLFQSSYVKQGPISYSHLSKISCLLLNTIVVKFSGISDDGGGVARITAARQSATEVGNGQRGYISEIGSKEEDESDSRKLIAGQLLGLTRSTI